MKILILSCDTGEGHNSAAKAVEEALLSHGVECVIKDPVSFKSEKTEYGLYIGVTICLLIFWFCMEQMVHLVGKVEALSQYLKGSEPYILYLVKAVGITYLCNFSSLVCKDAGFGAVAGQIEVFGKISVLLMGLPVLATVIENIGALSVG